MARFLAIVLSVWAVMHLYAFWRLSTVPWVAAHSEIVRIKLRAMPAGRTAIKTGSEVNLGRA